MIALITTCLRMLHIVLYRYDSQIILPANHLGKPVYIGCERAHDSNARYVLYICDHILYSALVAALFEGNAPEYISRDLRECAGIVGQLDAKMLSLNEAILEEKEKQEHEREEKIREDEHH